MNEALHLAKIFSDPMEAEIARQVLEEEGIRVFLNGSESAQLFVGLGGTVGEIRLEVPESDLAQATKLLDEISTPEGRRKHRRSRLSEPKSHPPQRAATAKPLPGTKPPKS